MTDLRKDSSWPTYMKAMFTIRCPFIYLVDRSGPLVVDHYSQRGVQIYWHHFYKHMPVLHIFHFNWYSLTDTHAEASASQSYSSKLDFNAYLNLLRCLNKQLVDIAVWLKKQPLSDNQQSHPFTEYSLTIVRLRCPSVVELLKSELKIVTAFVTSGCLLS